MMYANERRRAVKNAIALLEQKGCKLVEASVSLPIPVLTIDYPTIQMVKTGQLLNERKQGEFRKSYMTKLSGCIVRWYEDDDQKQLAELAQNLNPYAPELIALTPKNL